MINSKIERIVAFKAAKTRLTQCLINNFVLMERANSFYTKLLTLPDGQNGIVGRS